jgi:hypothetical protein
MSTADDETLKRRYREFLDLMPLTIAIAGLPASSGIINFSQDQMELRTQTLSAAFKLARQAARNAISGT